MNFFTAVLIISAKFTFVTKK